jgi:hypothetical protein
MASAFSARASSRGLIDRPDRPSRGLIDHGHAHERGERLPVNAG